MLCYGHSNWQKWALRRLHFPMKLSRVIICHLYSAVACILCLVPVFGCCRADLHSWNKSSSGLTSGLNVRSSDLFIHVSYKLSLHICLCLLVTCDYFPWDMQYGTNKYSIFMTKRILTRKAFDLIFSCVIPSCLVSCLVFSCLVFKSWAGGSYFHADRLVQLRLFPFAWEGGGWGAWLGHQIV